MKAATPRNVFVFDDVGISIHAAREGGDADYPVDLDNLKISIHAAREGGDRLCLSALDYVHNFNPRRP